MRDFTAVGGQLAHVTKLQSFIRKRNKQGLTQTTACSAGVQGEDLGVDALGLHAAEGELHVQGASLRHSASVRVAPHQLTRPHLHTPPLTSPLHSTRLQYNTTIQMFQCPPPDPSDPHLMSPHCPSSDLLTKHLSAPHASINIKAHMQQKQGSGLDSGHAGQHESCDFTWQV